MDDGYRFAHPRGSESKFDKYFFAESDISASAVKFVTMRSYGIGEPISRLCPRRAL